MALYSQIEDRYLSALTAVQFPEEPVANSQQPVSDATSVDGMQLAAGPSQTVTDAGAGRGSYAGFDPRQDAANKAPMGEIKPYDPTVREQLAEFLQAGFERFGMDRYRARKHAQSLIGGPNSNLPLDMGLADIVPFLGTALQTQEAVRMGGDAVTSAQQGNYGTAALQAGGAALGMVPGAAGTAKAAMAAGRAGERLAEKTVPQIMEKGGTLAELLQAMSQGSRSQLTAYHGTPHQFDKFDASKIGTGEGAQAYGYGIYFAQSEGVARQYMLANRGRAAAITGLLDDLPSGIQIEVMKVLNMRDGPIRSATLADLAEKNPKSADAIKRIADSKSGMFFTVDIPDSLVGKMLDFDAPIADQSPEIQALAKQYKLSPSDLGGDLLVAADGKTPAGAQKLREAGIPGVRYLDQGSRNSKASTRNIVVFPGGEDQVKILKQEGKK